MRKINFAHRLSALCLAFLLSNCTSNQKSDNAVFENSSGEETNHKTSEMSKDTNSNKRDDFIPFHWGMNDDAFSKALSTWKEKLTVNGNLLIVDVRLKYDGIKPSYDKNWHLEKLTIEFTKFSIHSETDYTEEEITRIKQIYLKHNQKIKHLIDVFSEEYGEPIVENFNTDSEDIYQSDGQMIIAQWKKDDTNAALCVKNEVPSEATGCNMEMWIELKKSN